MGASALAVVVGIVTFPEVASAAAPSGWTEIVRDSFARTDSNDWGSADVGGSYTLAYGSATLTNQFSVTAGAASATIGPGQSAQADLLAISKADVQVQTSFVVPTVGASSFGLYHVVQSRVQDNGSAYRGRIKIADGGTASLAVTRVDSNGDTLLGNYALPFAVASGQQVYLEFQVTGAAPVAMNLRSWLAGTAQPNWQFSVNDSSSSRISTAGSVGLWSYLSSSSTSTVVKTTGLNAWAPATTSPTTTTSTPTTTTTTTPTTTTTTATTALAPQPGRGSAAVGSTSYPIPSGAIFVSVNSGSDGNAGTESSPLKTLAAALNKAGSGKTIVLRGGTYNESVEIDTPVTIQAYPKEAVWMDGSVPVTNWTKSGTTWVSSGWTASFDRSTSYTRGDTSTRFLNTDYPLAAWPDMVFIDGAALKQVSSAAAVVAGTFYVDYAADTLRIGTDPSGRQVRSSNKAQAIYVVATNVTLQGFGVRRYATSIPDNGALRMGNDYGVLRDLMITDNATIGLGLRNDNITVQRVSVLRSGMLGIGGNAVYGLTIKDSVVQNNNVERFKDAPVSGGIKITRSRGLTVTNTDMSGNVSAGLWFDESCYDIKVTNSSATNNTTTGIQLEISDTGIVANNLVTGNQIGIQIINTGNVKIFNNEVGGNTKWGVRLKMDARRAADTSLTGHDPQRPNPDPTVPWIINNIAIANNVFGSGGTHQFLALDDKTDMTADQMRLTINGNLMNTSTSSDQAKMVGWGLADNKIVSYNTPADLGKAKNTGWVNAAVAPTSLSSMMSLKSTYNSIAVALPSDVAAAIGQPTGTKKLGRF